jgi:hypothetical protein
MTGEPIPVDLGALKLTLDSNGSFARRVSLAGEELFRGIGFVVRDANWGTPALLGAVKVVHVPGGRRGTVTGRLETGGKDLSWSLVWTISPTRLEAQVSVTSQKGYATNRTGFVVLHSLGASRGRPVRISHPGGSVDESRFPDLVSPHQPFLDIAGMDYESTAGHRVSARFAGEVFETEDQRNWTDASYKTYCRPLKLPFPYRIAPGEVVEQTVTIDVAESGATAAKGPGRPVAGPASPLPRLGTSLPPGRPTAGQAQALSLLRLDFTAVEIALDEPNAIEGATESLAIIPGPVRLDLRQAAPSQVDEALRALAPTLAGRTVLGVTLWDTSDQAVAAARGILPQLLIGGGTGAFFTELNRMTAWPEVDYLSWTSNPTVHGFDDDTLGETMEALPDILRSARAKLPVKRFHIGPMTLGLRYNPNATTSEGRRRAADPDPRQGSPVAAAWLGATLAGFHGREVEALAFFEPAGPKGLVDARGKRTMAGHLLERLARHSGRPTVVLRWPGDVRSVGLLIAGAQGPELCIIHAEESQAVLPVPVGRWTRLEDLRPEGFAAIRRGPDKDIEMRGFSVAWLTGG